MSNKHENGEEVERDGVREEEERRDRGESMTDSEASAPSEFDISSTEVDRLLESQGFDMSDERGGDGDGGMERALADSRLREGKEEDTSVIIESEWWTDKPDKPVSIRYGTSPVTSEPPETVLQLFQKTVSSHGNHHALGVKRQGKWNMCSYRLYYEQCSTVAKAFIQLGLDPFHGVCILGFNAPEWHMSCLGSILACGISVGLYLTSSTETCYNIANDCRAQIIVVENDSQLQKILKVKSRLPHLKAIVQYTKRLSDTNNEDITILEWRHLMQLGMGVQDETLKTRTDMLVPNKCCSLIYTSGTSGKPKGVMLSHDNLMWMCHRIMEQSTFRIGMEHIISYLPLSHIATQLLDIFTMLSCAGTCWFAQPDAFKGSLLHTMKEVRPTIFLGVPRVWEKIGESIQVVVSSQRGLKSKIASWAKHVGFKGNYTKQSGGSGTPFGWSIANVLFFKKVRHSLGLDRCHFPMAGSAPMSQETLTYFMSIDIPIQELYGMSETSGPTTITTTDRIRFMSSGLPFDGASIKIDNPEGEMGVGEVLVSGRHVFMGYLDEPHATSEVMTADGWLRSGDLGYISEEGYLYITGRMKEIIITASGEKVPPRPLEEAIKRELPIISNAIVIGDQQRFLCCLVTLKTVLDVDTGLPTDQLSEVAVPCCQATGSSAHTVSDIISGEGDHRVLKMIQHGMDRVNKTAASRIQKIAKWSILEQDFSVAGGELTPTMKLKRGYILMKYADCIETFYIT